MTCFEKFVSASRLHKSKIYGRATQSYHQQEALSSSNGCPPPEREKEREVNERERVRHHAAPPSVRVRPSTNDLQRTNFLGPSSLGPSARQTKRKTTFAHHLSPAAATGEICPLERERERERERVREPGPGRCTATMGQSIKMSMGERV